MLDKSTMPTSKNSTTSSADAVEGLVSSLSAPGAFAFGRATWEGDEFPADPAPVRLHGRELVFSGSLRKQVNTKPILEIDDAYAPLYLPVVIPLDHGQVTVAQKDDNVYAVNSGDVNAVVKVIHFKPI